MEGIEQSTELFVRLGFFLAVLLIMALWEVFLPRRTLVAQKSKRWTSNLILVALNIGLARLIMPMTAVAAAMFAQSRGWGIMHLVEWPLWFVILLSILAFDLAIYLQHVMFHAVPLFWRLHMVHHADLDIDVTTGLRFHTFEILLSALIKLAVVLLLGAPTLAVLIFEVLLNATSMFNHSNVKMTGWLDRLMRWFMVTPDMHRVHHSVIHRETNSNFGFNLPWWDYLMGTYQPQPEYGHEKMQIGLTEYTEEKQVDRLPGILMLPFSSPQSPSMLQADKTGTTGQQKREICRLDESHK